MATDTSTIKKMAIPLSLADGVKTMDVWAEVAAERDALQSDLASTRKENDTFRGLLGNSSKPCTYCGLAAADQAKCTRGFPGCARADDQLLSEHFAAGYDAELTRKELETTRTALAAAEKDAADLEWLSQRTCIGLPTSKRPFPQVELKIWQSEREYIVASSYDGVGSCTLRSAIRIVREHFARADDRQEGVK
jgi:hypothetical protein